MWQGLLGCLERKMLTVSEARKNSVWVQGSKTQSN